MDYTLNRTHAKILLGYLLVAAIFGTFLFLDYNQENQLMGYVILEEGLKVSTEKMDLALIEEIQSGNTQPKVLIVLEDLPNTGSSDLEERTLAIEEIQDLALEELQDKVNVLVPEEQKEILTSDGKASEEEILTEVNQDKLPDAEQIVQEQQVDLKVTQEYETINALAVEVKSGEALAELSNSPYVKKILLDYPVSVSLDQSAAQINAPQVWNFSVNGTLIDGSGETICVVDTGIDYTHPALGACNPVAYELNGTPEELLEPIESNHPYSDNFDHTWTITKENFTHLSLHFQNLSLETLGNGDSLDRVYIYDQNYQTLAMYKESLSDFWTPAGEGDTLYVRLVSDGSITNYGFLIDQVLDGESSQNLHWEACSKVVGGWDAYNNDPDPKDDHGHGTHVAGIVASNNETYRGIAPGARLVAVKALSATGSGYSSDVMAGIDWCNRNAQKYGISIMSMSLGCDGPSCQHYQDFCSEDLISASLQQAYEESISVFVASGNSGWTDGISNPACAPNAIPIGGVTESDQVLFNRGNLLKIVAPGTNIQSSILNKGWTSWSGTSMATPHAAGAAALLREYFRLAHQQELTPDEVEEKLAASGKQIYDSGSGNNYSRVDIYAAIFTDFNNSVVNESLNETIPLNESLPENSTLNETIPDNQTLPINESLPLNETLPNNESIPINESVPINETLPLNETLPNNQTNSTPINETPENLTSPVNETNVTLFANITSPLSGSTLELGNLAVYNLTTNLPGDLTYLWNFGDGNNSSNKSGDKRYYSAGYYLIAANVSNSNSSFLVNTSINVTDTKAPNITFFTYLSSVHLEQDKTQQVNLTVFDYSNIYSVRLILNALTKPVTSQNNNSYYWNISGLTLNNYTLYVEIKDNSSLRNGYNTSYTFTVTSCSDKIKNGNEVGIDCGGACGNCTTNITNTTPIIVSETPAQTTAPVSEVTRSVRRENPEIKRTESSVSTQAVPSAPVKAVDKEEKILNSTNEYRESKVSSRQTALYYLGGIVILLLGIYVLIAFKNNTE
jgi:subtilisin family serine protease